MMIDENLIEDKAQSFSKMFELDETDREESPNELWL